MFNVVRSGRRASSLIFGVLPVPVDSSASANAYSACKYATGESTAAIEFGEHKSDHCSSNKPV